MREAAVKAINFFAVLSVFEVNVENANELTEQLREIAPSAIEVIVNDGLYLQPQLYITDFLESCNDSLRAKIISGLENESTRRCAIDVLTEIAASWAEAAVIEFTHDESWLVRCHVLAYLRVIESNKSTVVAHKLLADENSWVREEALYIMRQFGEVEDAAAIALRIESGIENENEQRLLSQSLVPIATIREISALRKACDYQTSHIDALIKLASLNVDEPSQMVIDGYESFEVDVNRDALVIAMGFSGLAAYAPIIKEYHKDADEFEVAHILAMGMLGYSEIASQLQTYFNDANDETQLAIIASLCLMAAADNVEFFNAQLNHQNTQIKTCARMGIQILSPEKFSKKADWPISAFIASANVTDYKFSHKTEIEFIDENYLCYLLVLLKSTRVLAPQLADEFYENAEIIKQLSIEINGWMTPLSDLINLVINEYKDGEGYDGDSIVFLYQQLVTEINLSW